MRWPPSLTLGFALVAACGGTTGAAAPASPSIAAELTSEPPAEPPAEPAEPPSVAWLTALPRDGMLTYRVSVGDDTSDVRMLVQQRIERGGSVAVRLAPIGTPLEETPVYAQWLVGSSDGLRALEEHAAFTEPGFVPIDETGRLLTEAASHEVWRVETRWLRADRLSSGREASAGWTLLERVPEIEQPIAATRCVRLALHEGATRITQLVCADVGIVELERVEGEQRRERWQLVGIGARPEELE